MLPSSRVDDGICDCCDGSDEPEGTCPNTCRQMNAQNRQALVEELQATEQGLGAKAEYLETARQTLQRQQQELQQLEAELAEQQQALDQATALKDMLEEAERREQARREADAKAQHETEQEQKLREHGAQSQPEQAQAQAEPAAQQEPSSVDAPQEQAHEQEHEQPRQTHEQPKEPQPTLSEYAKWADSAPNVEPDHEAPEEGEHPYDLDHDEAYLQPEPDADERHDTLPSFQPAPPVEQYVDPEAEAARSSHRTAQSAVQATTNKIKELKAQMETDLGPDNVFSPLRNQCFSLDSKEYIYELCPFKDATQKAKVGHSHTSLGKWKEWDKQSDHSKMLYRDGLRCWQGQIRQTDVTVRCGSENKLVQVEEPSICSYTMVLQTPAACSEAHLQVLRMNLAEDEHEAQEGENDEEGGLFF